MSSAPDTSTRTNDLAVLLMPSSMLQNGKLQVAHPGALTNSELCTLSKCSKVHKKGQQNLKDPLQEDRQHRLQGLWQTEARHSEGQRAPLPPLLLPCSADSLLEGAHIRGHHLLWYAAGNCCQSLPAAHQNVMVTVLCHENHKALHTHTHATASVASISLDEGICQTMQNKRGVTLFSNNLQMQLVPLTTCRCNWCLSTPNGYVVKHSHVMKCGHYNPRRSTQPNQIIQQMLLTVDSYSGDHECYCRCTRSRACRPHSTIQRQQH